MVRIERETFVENKDRLLEEILTRGVVDIITKDSLSARLAQGRPLRVKYGIDPTMTSAHIGHVVPIRKLKQFQELGHTAVFIIGDYTARIGDPTGRSSAREALSQEQVQRNVKYYLDQAYQILDKDRTEVHLQSEWYGEFGLEEVIRLMSKTTYGQLMAHETFSKRVKEGRVLNFHEMLYPLIQAYDSVAVKADVELGGADQRFNFVLTRDLQKTFGQIPEEVILCRYLPGIDGQEKMSKSLGNTINLSDSAKRMYFSIMSMPDELMEVFFELATEIPLSEIHQMFVDLKSGNIHPMELKKKLAIAVCSLYYQIKEVQEAASLFRTQVQRKETPEELPVFKVGKNRLNLVEFLLENAFVKSKSEAKRLIEQGGVRLNGEQVVGEEIDIEENKAVLRVGRKILIKLTV